MFVPPTNAPEINTKFGWVNTDQSYSIKDFRGKFVLLDFWTFGCINCHHIVPDLKRLEQEYEDVLLIIGIHSAKFPAEQASERILKATAKLGINHPVVNDADYSVWQSYAINAWPTVVLISPDGKVVGQKAGEGVYQVVKAYLDELIPHYSGKLNGNFLFDLNEESRRLLCFPSKMIKDKEDRLWVSDSGNNRILQISDEGEIIDSIGDGLIGFNDGSFSTASFNQPHGLALDKDRVLYIADTQNHRIRVANLVTREVQTVAGDGSLDYYFFDERIGQQVNPNSPWDLLIYNGFLFIASAGNHQILRMHLTNNELHRFAGTGREALADGSLVEAAFNQPSGLCRIGDKIFVADAEASAVRLIDLRIGKVKTLIGKGLFDFGDKDGPFDKASLQHPLSVRVDKETLYVVDTYNGKIKNINLNTQEIETISSGFEEPNDVVFFEEYMIVSDTNNHRLMRVFFKDNSIEELKVIDRRNGALKGE